MLSSDASAVVAVVVSFPGTARGAGRVGVFELEDELDDELDAEVVSSVLRSHRVRRAGESRHTTIWSLNLYRFCPLPMQGMSRRAQREQIGLVWSHCEVSQSPFYLKNLGSGGSKLTFFFCLRQASQPRPDGTPGIVLTVDSSRGGNGDGEIQVPAMTQIDRDTPSHRWDSQPEEPRPLGGFSWTRVACLARGLTSSPLEW